MYQTIPLIRQLSILILIKFAFIVCGTTGKRKACKDCSCGLAEELSGEGDSSTVGKQAPTSSCGSVSIIYYLPTSFIFLTSV